MRIQCSTISLNESIGILDLDYENASYSLTYVTQHLLKNFFF